MPRSYPKSSRVRKPVPRTRKIKRQAQAQARELQLPLNVETLLQLAREKLSLFAVEVGLNVAQCLLEDEVNAALRAST